MPGVGRLIDFLGGAIVRVAVTGILIGLFAFLVGMTPAAFFVYVLEDPPAWIDSSWFRLGFIIIGLVFIGGSVRYNFWSQKQQAIDELAEDISSAITDLLNRTPRPQTDDEVTAWQTDYNDWCAGVSKKLENRAFFTRADQLHFDRLGFIEPISMGSAPGLNWLLSQLRHKFDRLRDVINWTQQRRR